MRQHTKTARAGPAQAPESLHEGFKSLGTVRPDPRGRLTLAKSKESVAKMPQATAYQQLVNEFGEILLIPVVEIPLREIWIHQDPEAFASLQRGIGQAARGEIQALDLNDLPED